MVVPLLNIPIISVVLLLLAGILIGHLIWYRDRSDDEAMLVDLRGQNRDLEMALHEHKQAYVALQVEVDDQRKSWEQLKVTNLELEHARQASQFDLVEINNELARLQQLKDQAFHDLDQERQHRRAIQEALAEAETQITQAAHLSEHLQTQLDASEQQRHELAQQAETASQWAALEADYQDKIAHLTAQRDNATQERNALLHRLEASQADAETIERLRAQEDAFQTQLADQAASLASIQMQLHHREEDLDSLRLERDDALQQVDAERQRSEKIERRVGNVEQLVAQRDQAIERATVLQDTLEQIQRRADTLAAELDEKTQELHVLQNSHEEASLELKQETDVLRRKLADLTCEHEAVSQVLIDERTRLSSMESENLRLASMAAEAEAIASAHSSQQQAKLARTQVELDTVRTELEELAAQLSRERHQREHLQNVVHAQKTHASALEAEKAKWKTQWESLQAERAELVVSLQAELNAKDEVLRALDEQRCLADSELHRVAGEKENLQRRVHELNQQTSQLTSQVANLRASHEEQVAESERMQDTYRAALSKRIDLEANNTEMQEHVQRLQTELDDALEVKQLNVELKTRLERVVAQRDEAMQSNAGRDSHLEELERNLQQLQATHDEALVEAEALKEQLSELDDLRQWCLQLENEAQDSCEQLRRVTVERNSQRDALLIAETRLERLESLESRARANEETIRNLRRERAAVLANSRQPSTFSFSSRSLAEPSSGGRMRRDDVLGMVYTQPPKQKDDLKRITGIAQVLEKKLNAFGVYTYRQIMEWDAVAIAEFSKLLSFRDRIERDDWVGQARSLHFEMYGRAA